MSPLQLPYAGAHTFARSEFVGIEAINPGSVAVIGVPYDSTGLRQGMHQGPSAIREASVDFIYPMQTAGTLVELGTGRSLTWSEELNLVDLGDLPIQHSDLDSADSYFREFGKSVVAKGAMPLALGGDRWVTNPLFLGFADAIKQRNQKPGLILLSSGLGMGHEHPTWGKRWHGATLRRILESGLVESSNIVVAGVHGLLSYQEWEEAKRAGITVLPLKELRQQGMEAAAQRALEVAGNTADSIYLSMDISAVDAGQAPGQGDVLVDGLTARELLQLSRYLANPKVGAVDGVGVAPQWDPGGRAQRLMAEALVEVIAPKVFQTNP